MASHDDLVRRKITLISPRGQFIRYLLYHCLRAFPFPIPLSRSNAWTFAPLRDGLGGESGSAAGGIRYGDVRELVSEHLGLAKAEAPDLSFAEGVLCGDGKLRESVSEA